MTNFCGIGDFISFMVDGLLIFDWMGVWELCFDEMSLDAELLVFNGDFGGVLFDEMLLDAELLVFNGDFSGVVFDEMPLDAAMLVFNGDCAGVLLFNGVFGFEVS